MTWPDHEAIYFPLPSETASGGKSEDKTNATTIFDDAPTGINLRFWAKKRHRNGAPIDARNRITSTKITVCPSLRGRNPHNGVADAAYSGKSSKRGGGRLKSWWCQPKAVIPACCMVVPEFGKSENAVTPYTALASAVRDRRYPRLRVQHGPTRRKTNRCLLKRSEPRHNLEAKKGLEVGYAMTPAAPAVRYTDFSEVGGIGNVVV